MMLASLTKCLPENQSSCPQVFYSQGKEKGPGCSTCIRGPLCIQIFMWKCCRSLLSRCMHGIVKKAFTEVGRGWIWIQMLMAMRMARQRPTQPRVAALAGRVVRAGGSGRRSPGQLEEVWSLSSGTMPSSWGSNSISWICGSGEGLEEMGFDASACGWD